MMPVDRGFSKQCRYLSRALAVVAALGCVSVAGQSRCTNPNRNAGTCISVYDCSSLLEVLQSDFSLSQRQFIRQSECSAGSGQSPFVCCTSDRDYAGATAANTRKPTTTTSRRPSTNPLPSNGAGAVLPQPPQCGPVPIGDRIYSGNETQLDEYPWMVLMGYTEKSGQVSLNCAGSLINQRYVLTAAHCVQGEIEREIGKLSVVRLGEHDISMEIDCIQADCNNKVLELGVEEATVHPQYDDASAHRHHDIALLRLTADVPYSDFIRPVCLPLALTRTAISVGERLIVAGWGRTLQSRQSNTKQQLAVPIKDPAECASKFRTRKVNLIASQICAGGEFARDSCGGDSGGPLMRLGAQSRWFLEGVVSFGYKCGLEGWPGIYTRVGDYVDWIQQSMRP